MRPRYKSGLIFIITSFFLQACEIEDVMEPYTNDDGSYIVCPPSDVKNASLLYVESKAKTSDSHQIICAQSCDNAYFSTIDTSIECVPVSDERCSEAEKKSFSYGLCPKGSMCNILPSDGLGKTAQYYCGQPIHSCRTNSDCNMPGWEEGVCDNGKCAVKKCAPNYHLYANGCEYDTVDNCGSHNVQCSMPEHARAMNCIQGKCGIQVCEEGYVPSVLLTCVKKENAIYDTVDQCGSLEAGVISRCSTFPGWIDGDCQNFRCVASQCKDGYKIAGANDDISVPPCILISDTEERCGTPETGGVYNCKTLAGWKTGSCTNNKCVASECMPGYRIPSATEPDSASPCVIAESVTHCGGTIAPGSTTTTGGIDCTKKFGLYTASISCKEGQCILGGCEAGYHLNSAKNKCEQDTVNACGSYNNKCATYPNTTSKCTNGACQYICNSGYDNCDGILEKNGCETKLSDYYLSSCEKCQQNYIECGPELQYGVNGEYIIAFCLKQGNTYINYKIDRSPDNSSYYSHVSNGSEYVHFDYKGPNAVEINFGQWHYYQFVKNSWNSSIYSWNAVNCVYACRVNFMEFRTENQLEAWSHFCDLGQTCHMYDSYEVKNGSLKHYVDFACTN